MSQKLDLGTPEKFDFGHFFIRNAWLLPWFLLWYKNITVVGKKNIQKNTATIFAINHQNTAMDPLALVGTLSHQITWLARADLYKKKALIPILHCFKILPIFRQRDGLKNLENNDIVFEKIADVLTAHKTVGIFPEGTHWGFRRLRQTRKAISRLVEVAEQRNNYNLDININPVGVYYDDYKKIRTDLFVKIGEPIPVKKYISLMQENPKQAENDIKDAIDAGMRECMLDIPQMDDDYYLIEQVREICRETTESKFPVKGNRQTRQFLTDKKTIEIVENEISSANSFLPSIKEKLEEFESLRTKKNFSYEIIKEKGYSAFQLIWNCMLLVAGLPLFLCSCILWSGNYLCMKKMAKLADDPLFKNSIMFVGGRVTCIIFNLIFIVLWLIFVPLPWWTVFLFWIGIFLLWPVFIDYPRLFKRTMQGLAYNAALMTKEETVAKLGELQDEIQNEFSKLL